MTRLQIMQVSGVAFLCCLLSAQPPTIAVLMERGAKALNAGRYRDAINLFEEAWELSPEDPLVCENFALALMYGERDFSRSSRLMKTALERGGQATFLVQHLHEKGVGTLTQTATNYCPGRLSVRRGRIAFVSATEPGHSFTLAGSEIREVRPNRVVGAAEAGFHIRAEKKEALNFSPRTGSESERALIIDLISQYARKELSQ